MILFVLHIFVKYIHKDSKVCYNLGRKTSEDF